MCIHGLSKASAAPSLSGQQPASETAPPQPERPERQSTSCLDQFEEALQRVFPEIGAVAPLRLLNGGFRSIVVETAGGAVFRIGKNAEAWAGYLREWRLLPRLRGRLPLAVPDPRWYAAPSAHFPHGLMGYPRLPGTSLLPEHLSAANETRIASDLGGFLAALHRFPAEEAEALDLPPSPAADASWQALRDAVLPPLRSALSAAEYRAIVRWWDSFLADQEMGRYAPVLCHGDLWYEHLLVDGARRRLVGIVDFEGAGLGDPAQDIATQLYLGEAFAARVVDAYLGAGGAVDGGFNHRVRRLWEVREFGGVAYAVRYDDQPELADSLKKLRAGPILNPNARSARFPA